MKLKYFLLMYSRYSVECIVIRLHAARTRFVSRQWQDILVLSKVFGLAVGLSKLPSRWVQGLFIPVVNWPLYETGRSLASSAGVKNDCTHIRIDNFSHDTGLT
jgi:hypothetical protein